MIRILVWVLAVLVIWRVDISRAQSANIPQVLSTEFYGEKYRPQLHFSPAQNWMNDPNGLLFFEGEYHLFYQHDQYGKVFTNMSWGHAISNDLVHWKEYPKAIFPDGDGLGLIFSGSAVVDKNNTAGFGSNAFVAIYTATEPQQQQCIAYSSDKGRTWTKYKNNPVIANGKNDNIPDDFRDPKVMWHENSKKWIMSLAVKDHIEFWSSPNLREWSKESEFGIDVGGHGGVWECPDLFELPVEAEPQNRRWVLLANINPGGPNGGSATQYFVGDFDGKNFSLDTKFERYMGTQGCWADYGTDNYAEVTWSNVSDRKIALGWMNNWNYAMKAPTYPWRGAMTVPKKLRLVQTEEGYRLASWPVAELESNYSEEKEFSNEKVSTSFRFPNTVTAESPYELTVELRDANKNGFVLELSNDLNQKVSIGFLPKENKFFIDRTQSGKGDFSTDFLGKHYGPRISKSDEIKLRILVDRSSIEVFADDGLTVMTDLLFPDKILNDISISSPKERIVIKRASLKGMKKIW